jgi:hypothetical protein
MENAYGACLPWRWDSDQDETHAGAWLTLTENPLHCAVRDSFPPRAMIRKLMALRTLIVDDFGIAGVIVGTMRSRQLVLP